MSNKVASIIADRFIAELNKGVAPWSRGFQVAAPSNVKSRKAYRGINWFLLSMLGVDYALTFNQAKELGGSVKKGAKGIPVVFWNWIKKNEGQPDESKVPFLRYYTVFSLADTEGVQFTPPATIGAENKRIATAEELFAKCKAAGGFTVTEGGNQPAYWPALHSISQPNFGRWESESRFYKTLFHECGHALGAKLGKSFAYAGGEYAKEELVAELFAAMALSHLGICDEKAWDNSVAYVQGWAKKLGSEPQLLIQAAGEAQKRWDLVFPPAQVESEESE